MQLSAKTENACLAVFELASRYDQPQPVCLRVIADAHAISGQFLVQILLSLKRGGIVHSTRGAGGGYRLARPPSEISLLDVVAAMEGPPAKQPLADDSSVAARILRETMSEMAGEQLRQLDEITFDELVSRVPTDSSAMYYI